MGSFSPVHWIIFLLILAVYGYPIVRVLKRTGFSGWWVLLMVVPLVNIIALWIYAFAPWKIDAAKPVEA
jgi:hypothetical protein